jgi:molybdate transport system substrate-binding protein
MSLSHSQRTLVGQLSILVACVVSAHAVSGQAKPVTVFAAASLSGALNELWPDTRHPRISVSYAGSSTLARQIEAGAPADLFLSANEGWMDYLQVQGHIDSTTRRRLLGNRLVVIAPVGEGFPLDLKPDVDLDATFVGRLAIADPDHVPAGIYSRQALQALGWWQALSARLTPAADVRTALRWVERGECASGIVYATDAKFSSRVEIVAAVADSLHTPIRYPIALVAGRVTAATRRLLDTLNSPAARRVFLRHGFTLLPPTPQAR